MENRKIEIDLRVHKLIELNRLSLRETDNDILYRILSKTQPEGTHELNFVKSNNSDVQLVFKSVPFHEGMQLRHKHKGDWIYAEIKNGKVHVNGNSYQSPADAANRITQTSRNCWIFWEFKDDVTGQWELIDSLRNKN